MRAAIRSSTVKSKSMVFQPVITSGSNVRTRLQNASSAARSSMQRVAFSGIGRSLPSTMSTSSRPGAYSEIASRRSPFASVSMSNDSTRGSTSTCAGRMTGLSNTGDVRARHGLAFDLAAALDTALDQVAHGEAHVGLERVDAGVMQAIAQGRDIRGCFHRYQSDGRAIEGALVDGLWLGRAELPSALGVGRSNVEVRTLAIVPHEERAAVREPPVNVDHGPAPAAGRRDDAIAGLEDEAARGRHRVGVYSLRQAGVTLREFIQ